MSKPGLRRYVRTETIPRVLNGLGIAILSTSKGIIVDREARKQKRRWRAALHRLVRKRASHVPHWQAARQGPGEGEGRRRRNLVKVEGPKGKMSCPSTRS